MAEITLLQGAQADFLEVYCQFGERFYRQAEIAFGQLAAFPESAPEFYHKFRRIVIQQTPYGAFFTVVGNRVMIGAILDLRQDPERIVNHLKRLE